MKKINILLILALTVMFVQCKKETATLNNPSGGTEYSFSLYAGGDAKGDIDGNSVKWSEGDRVYVGNSSGFLGYLTLSSGAGTGDGTFTGNIKLSEPIGNEGVTLHFYYLGEADRRSDINAGDESFIIDFSNQDGTLDGIEQNFHVGYGSASITSANIDANNNVVSASTSFTTKIAIAYMNLESFAGEDVVLSGADIVNSMAVNFKTGQCSYSNNTNIFVGYVTSGIGKYIALLPTTHNATILRFRSVAKQGEVEFFRGIEENKFYRKNNGDPIAVAIHHNGKLPGLFSVAEGRQVCFSQGNLQYMASMARWRFAWHQYDYVGDAVNGNVYGSGVKCNNELISSTYSGWIDLFGWSTSGYNNKYPYMTSTTNTDYGNGNNNIFSTNYDWGVYNAISNGGNQAGMWRTLTNDEWFYLFNTRIGASSKYSQATVNNVRGLVILPDTWTLPSGVTFTAQANNWTSNNYSISQWNLMESNGAVFLPAAGYRYGASVGGVGTSGYCWSSSYYNENRAYNMRFSTDYVSPSIGSNRYYGHSVRLVADY